MRVVIFDDDPAAVALEAADQGAWNAKVHEGAEASGWAPESFLEDVKLAERHMDYLVHALITTLEHRRNADEDGADEYIAQPLLDAAESLDIPKLIISTQPDAELFIEPRHGDHLVADTDPETIKEEVISWLGGLTTRYATNAN